MTTQPTRFDTAIDYTIRLVGCPFLVTYIFALIGCFLLLSLFKRRGRVVPYAGDGG